MTAPVADFGPLVTNVDVDDAVLDMLKQWMPTYLAQTERERGQSIGRFKRPEEASYASTLEDDEFPDHKLPAIFVTSANTTGQPDKDGDGLYMASWNVVVSSVVRGRRANEARWIAAMFEGAVRRIMVQQAMPINGEIRWTATNVAPVKDPTPANRPLAAGIGTYVVYVDHVLQEGVGPIEVQPDPSEAFDPLAQVRRVDVDVVGLPPIP